LGQDHVEAAANGVAFSFNDPAGRFNYTWQGFTLDNWKNWDAVPGLVDAMGLSLQIAALSSIIATSLGTLIGLALVRHDFRGRGSTNLLIFLPMSTPEIVLGASLLSLFLTWHFPLGFWSIRMVNWSAALIRGEPMTLLRVMLAMLPLIEPLQPLALLTDAGSRSAEAGMIWVVPPGVVHCRWL